MKKKICVLLACVAMLSAFGVAFAQNTANDVLPATDNTVSTTSPTKPAVPAPVPMENPEPAPTEPIEQPIAWSLKNLAFFDTERENVEMFAATTDVELSSVQGTVVYAQDNEVRIDTHITEFCFQQAGPLPYQVGDTTTIWVAVTA